MLQPPKRHVFLEFLAEKKAFHFPKRALRAGTARNKWLKKALNFNSRINTYKNTCDLFLFGREYV